MLSVVIQQVDDYVEASVVVLLRGVFNIVKDNPTNQAIVTAAGGARVITQILRHYITTSVDICQECTAIVHILSRCSENMSTSLEAAILDFSANGCLPCNY